MEASVLLEPPAVQSDIDPAIILGAFAVITVGACIWAIRLAIRERDMLPIAACLGALVCSLNEPIYDILGKIVYAQNHAVAYTAMDRDVPWFLVIGYVPWVGALAVAIARMMANGVDRKVLHYIALGSCLSVVVVETLGNYFNGWIYYGEAPLKYLVVAPQMAPVPIVGGLLLYSLAFPLTGWRRAVAAFSVCMLALPMVFASASWPLYFGLYANMPALMNWVAGAAMLGFSVAMVVGATSIGHELYRAREKIEEHTSSPSRVTPRAGI